MYQRIKTLADEAVALQNKGRMEAALREISELCASGGAMDAEQFEAAEKAQHDAGKTRAASADSFDSHDHVPVEVAAKKAAKK